MIFYISILIVLILFSLGEYSKIKSFLTFLILFLIISLKGEIGPDYYGYLNRYEFFDPVNSFLLANGEYSWYLIEYTTYINQWSYQMYYVFTAIFGIGFLVLAQSKIRHIGFLVFVFQLLFVQLGLSGVRQFIAVCILVYAFSLYLFEHQKSINKFILLIFLAASFHISALFFIYALPFLLKLSKKQIIFVSFILMIAFFSEIFLTNIEKYDIRYLEGSKSSSGAWIRFAITAFIIKLSLIKSNKNIYYFGLSILVFGLFLGLINSIALHRFNYYFLPISCLLLIKNYKLALVKKYKINFVYAVSILYLLFWFTFSKYADSFIPYTFFFN